MKQVCVAIYDVKAQAYMRPFFTPREAMAVRMFVDEVNRAAEDNPLYRHPEDYRLMFILEWDDESGQVVPSDQITPRLIVEAANVKQGG